jgi:hypothetical protein
MMEAQWCLARLSAELATICHLQRFVFIVTQKAETTEYVESTNHDSDYVWVSCAISRSINLLR